MPSYDLRMAWNIEWLFVRAAESTTLEEVVPDVFAPTGESFGFEDATSVQRDPDLCATWLNGWVILIDVNCRLSGLEAFLLETSTLGEVSVFRISGFPIAVRCGQGTILERLEGHSAFITALEPERFQPDEASDGELLAWALMDHRTGVSLDDLWDLKFKLFRLA
jgi:hypothetical protein